MPRSQWQSQKHNVNICPPPPINHPNPSFTQAMIPQPNQRLLNFQLLNFQLLNFQIPASSFQQAIIINLPQFTGWWQIGGQRSDGKWADGWAAASQWEVRYRKLFCIHYFCSIDSPFCSNYLSQRVARIGGGSEWREESAVVVGPDGRRWAKRFLICTLFCNSPTHLSLQNVFDKDQQRCR